MALYKYLFIAILPISISMLAQAPINADQDLIGKWVVEKVEISNVIEAEQGKSPSLTDTSSRKNWVNALAKSISEEYLHSVFYFKNNNKLKIKTKGKKVKGTYIYYKEEGYIYTDIANFKKLFFSSLDKNTLIINKIDENDVIKLVYKRK